MVAASVHHTTVEACPADPAGGCGRWRPARTSLAAAPEVFTLLVAWQDVETSSSIGATWAAIPQRVNLGAPNPKRCTACASPDRVSPLGLRTSLQSCRWMRQETCPDTIPPVVAVLHSLQPIQLVTARTMLILTKAAAPCSPAV